MFRVTIKDGNQGHGHDLQQKCTDEYRDIGEGLGQWKFQSHYCKMGEMLKVPLKNVYRFPTPEQPSLSDIGESYCLDFVPLVTSLKGRNWEMG